MNKQTKSSKGWRYRWFSRYVIAAMLVDGKQKGRSLARFVCTPAFIHFTIVICVSRDCMKTTYYWWPDNLYWGAQETEGYKPNTCILNLTTKKDRYWPQAKESILSMAEDLNTGLSRKTLASDYRVEIRLTMLGLSGRRWLTLIFLPSPLKKNRPLLRRLAWPPNETKKFVNFTLARIAILNNKTDSLKGKWKHQSTAPQHRHRFPPGTLGNATAVQKGV